MTLQALDTVKARAIEAASLQILSGGSVTIDGDITITGSDIPADAEPEMVTLSDTEMTVTIDSSTQAILDIRAGTMAVKRPGTKGELEGSAAALEGDDNGASADITLGNVIFEDADSLVLITNQFEPNSELAGGTVSINEILMGSG